MLLAFIGIMVVASVEPIEGQAMNHGDDEHDGKPNNDEHMMQHMEENMGNQTMIQPIKGNQTMMPCMMENQTVMMPVTMGNQTIMMPFIMLAVTIGNQTMTMPFMMMPVMLENQTMMPFMIENQTMTMPFMIANQTMTMPFIIGNQTMMMPFIMGNQTMMPATMGSQGSSGKSAVVEVTQLEQINTSLQKSPVFLRIGAKWCPHCQSMNPILEKMAAEYTGNATIASIDVDQSPELTEYFGVKMFPDSSVIVGIENGTYVYMQENGTVSTDRSQARFIGLNETAGPNEETFEKVLDLAVLLKGEDKSK
jgi:thioredoxin 1